MGRVCKANYLWLVVAVFAFTSCKPRKPHVVNHAFYYWQHNFNLYWHDSGYFYLNKLRPCNIYVKALDVDWNEVNHAYPSSITRFSWYIGKDSVINRIAQVVFITNNTMQK